MLDYYEKDTTIQNILSFKCHSAKVASYLTLTLVLFEAIS